MCLEWKAYTDGAKLAMDVHQCSACREHAYTLTLDARSKDSKTGLFLFVFLSFCFVTVPQP